MNAPEPVLPWAPDVLPTGDEIDWYEIGYHRGWDDAQAKIEAAEANRWAALRLEVRRLAQAPTHEELVRRRAAHRHHDPVLAACAERAAKVSAVVGWAGYLRAVAAEWGVR